MEQQPRWLERAKNTYKFHRLNRLNDDSWTTTQTAAALRRSIGSVSEDLLIISWYKTNRLQIEKFKFAYEVLNFIRTRQREMELEEIE